MNYEIAIRPSSMLLWISIIAGPVSFAVDMESRFALVQWACFNHREWVLTVITTTAFIAAAGAAALGWTAFTRLGGLKLHSGTPVEGLPESGPVALHRARFMAICGFILGSIFALSIIANGVPHLFLRACD
jgi:hypothetical protein